MATVSSLVSTTNTSNVSSYTSGSFIPAQGDLLVVFAIVSATLITGATCTASANGITFTLVDSTEGDAGNDRLYMFVADQLVPASPVSMTVTVDTGADPGTGSAINVLAVSGMSRTGLGAVK